MPDDIQQHLDTYKAKDDAKTVFQICEVFGHGSQSEIERPQTKDGKHVAGEYDERVTTDREDCGDAIYSKGYIGGLYHEQSDEQRGGQTLTVIHDEELVIVHLVGHREKLLKEFYEDVL